MNKVYCENCKYVMWKPLFNQCSAKGKTKDYSWGQEYHACWDFNLGNQCPYYTEEAENHKWWRFWRSK